LYKGGQVPLCEIFSKKDYRTYAPILKCKQLMFLDQITTLDGAALFTLPDLKFSAARLTIPKAPVWFLKLQSLLISSPNTRIIPSIYHHPHSNNIYSIPPIHIKSTTHFAVGWHVTSYSAIIGKVLRINNDIVHLQYFNASPDHTFRTSLIPCTRCSLNDDSSFVPSNMRNKHEACLVKLPLHLYADIKAPLILTVGHICSLSPYMLYEIALYSYNLTAGSALNIPSTLSSPSLIPDQIFNVEILNILDNLKSHFIQSTNLSFYTDGSLINLGTSSIRMSVAWL